MTNAMELHSMLRNTMFLCESAGLNRLPQGLRTHEQVCVKSVANHLHKRANLTGAFESHEQGNTENSKQ